MSESFHHTHPSYLEISKWTYSNPNLVAGMTTRIGGEGIAPFDSFNLGWHVPDVKETIRKNRETLANLLQFPLEHWIGGEQVHDTEVYTVKKKDIGKGALSQDNALPNCDGLITNLPNVLLTAFYADCVPLFFYDPVEEWVGIAHAGWKGTVAGMGPEMIRALEDKGVDANHIKVAIGPSISGDVYEVDENVLQHIPSELRVEPTVLDKGNGKYLLSLQNMHKHLLLESGVKEKNIEVSEYCTYQNDHLFFSHRRDQGKTGRMLGFIGLKRLSD
ncbi:peptidoglycan editing factor PgeF [Pontibacillus yanchengensis]|uniref:Purine nucleoside phosphorylase n=2 Tax=Pontibacillus yanchengensis TaxID=462910 RepID=A0A6I4ZYK9_9BACI|nr:peptidoglycan editing factor PgeF [Pontibacillus yanchengensis]MYL33060.1 peptidoglycan editing factor PgeF [Pontibacillus yanchengensis]MYL52089.1 peptidoglycan editing factor PgeF [Pontibacillus yanchengensis]